MDRILHPHNRQVLPKRRNTVRMNHKLTVEDDLQVYGDQIRVRNKAIGTSQLCLLIDPKSDSSVSKVHQQLPCWTEALQWRKVILKPPWGKWMLLYVDTPIGNEGRSYMWYKRWPSAKSKTRCAPSEPKDLDYPQKFRLRVVVCHIPKFGMWK
jgi:hypothetical protein